MGDPRRAVPRRARWSLMDGAPDHPAADRLWSIVERHRVTHLGVAPTLVRALAAHGPEAAARHDLSSVRILGSTGEPWDDASYRWFFDVAGGGRCPVINISGGTELMGCLLAPLPVAPLKATLAAGTGARHGRRRRRRAGRERARRGRLPRLPQRGAEHDARIPRRPGALPRDLLRASSASRSGATATGRASTSDGDWFLTGRADDTLKIAGKRVGPGEVEAAAISHPAVREAAAIGLPDPVKGTALVVLAVARPGHDPSPTRSATEVAAHLAAHLGVDDATVPRRVGRCASGHAVRQDPARHHPQGPRRRGPGQPRLRRQPRSRRRPPRPCRSDLLASVRGGIRRTRGCGRLRCATIVTGKRSCAGGAPAPADDPDSHWSSIPRPDDGNGGVKHDS